MSAGMAQLQRRVPLTAATFRKAQHGSRAVPAHAKRHWSSHEWPGGCSRLSSNILTLREVGPPNRRADCGVPSWDTTITAADVGAAESSSEASAAQRRLLHERAAEGRAAAWGAPRLCHNTASYGRRRRAA